MKKNYDRNEKEYKMRVCCGQGRDITNIPDYSF